MKKLLSNLWYKLRYGETPPDDKYLRAIYLNLKKKSPNGVHMIDKRDA